MASNSALITLTTDFGYDDPFVGIMKGVIFGINPQARVVDLSHGIPPQELKAAALVLKHSVPYFPQGTIHIAVVDPGVGSERRPLLIESDGNYFVGPDNGVLSLALAGKEPSRIVELSKTTYHRRPISATFHGRDIFAPVAAHLSLGTPPTAFGATVDSFLRLSWPKAVKSERGIEGEIVYIDRFGNLCTNIQEQDLTGLGTQNFSVALRDVVIQGLAPSYAAGESGHCVALLNSWGLLEIALYKGSAQRLTQAKMGDRVYIEAR